MAMTSFMRHDSFSCFHIWAERDLSAFSIVFLLCYSFLSFVIVANDNLFHLISYDPAIPLKIAGTRVNRKGRVSHYSSLTHTLRDHHIADYSFGLQPLHLSSFLERKFATL